MRNDLGNMLVVSFNDISNAEFMAFNSHKVFCGLRTTPTGGCMIYFDFSGFNFEQPFNISTLVEANVCAIDETSSEALAEERLLINAILVDHATTLVKSLRTFTLPLNVTQELYKYIRKHLEK
ncbi:hypothetical protein [Photobacterium kishitanii]|uniref:hypothetical protein n=1 Tax=Photobacterium kishitanii TaxID=318456 RepID=UPI002739A0D6|nr:hypothetical protein [Photobacterium kishitanii]